jgi:sugar-specific transcriptional regulator TrmB
MRDRERQQWTEYVRRLEEKKGKKPRKPHAKKPPEVSPAELEQTLNELIGEAKERL